MLVKREMEILCIGNELLIGKTLNTNAHWLAKRATSLGINVRRITVVGDSVEEIVVAVKEALERRPQFIITTGGLGPTFDDKTLEGLAQAFSKQLTINKRALDMIIKKYEAYFGRKMRKSELTPARAKMATLPNGAEPLLNPAGTAPGVLMHVEGTVLAALPGVPPEMEAIFGEYLAPVLKKAAGKTRFFERSIRVGGIVESALAPLIDKAMRDNPQVYVKSHVYTEAKPESEGKKPGIELHLSTTATNADIAEKQLEKTEQALISLVRENGGKPDAGRP